MGFCWEIKGGTTFVTPQVALCYSDQGLGKLSRSYSDFIRQQIINPNFVYTARPIVINNWEATYFNFNEEKLFPIIDAAAKIGMDTFVLDDGWFGKRDNDISGLGDWFVNTSKLKGGLNSLIERCKQRGMKFGLWVEPEMISEDSDLYRAHPDWVIGKDGVKLSRSRNQLVLDFTRKEVVDHIYSSISKILSEHEISYLKWDMNRSITECYSSELPSERQGEFMHRYILGVYDLAERLTKQFPHLLIEGCAGGGGRFDTGMLYYFPQIWTSDNTDACERSKIQWGTSFCYPVSSMICHVSDCPNHLTHRTVPMFARGVIASLGATGYELDLSKLTARQKKEIKKQVKEYKKIADLVLKGDLYRLSDPFSDGYFCEMLVSKDKKSAYVAGLHYQATPFENEQRIKLDGLNEESIYLVEELNSKLTGAALMRVGIPINQTQDYSAWTFHIHKV